LKDKNADIRNIFGGNNATRFNRDAEIAQGSGSVSLTRAQHLKMNVKVKTLPWKQLSHSAWLAILTCSFSGVFVCNL